MMKTLDHQLVTTRSQFLKCWYSFQKFQRTKIRAMRRNEDDYVTDCFIWIFNALALSLVLQYLRRSHSTKSDHLLRNDRGRGTHLGELKAKFDVSSKKFDVTSSKKAC
mmetsp:Transcript_15781/g.23229  ORF Transcript_15781/g.23229 Transcript_15781/m.23229 type:complete len:108 (-) Transcript_15781:200-523(-)